MTEEFTANYRIYYEDTDAGGVVYYANYLKFFERARTDFLRERSIFQTELMLQDQGIFVVRKCQIEYKNSAKLDDLVTIKTTIDKIGSASIKMHQEMFNQENILLNILDVEIAYIDSDSKRPKKIPNKIKNILHV